MLSCSEIDKTIGGAASPASEFKVRLAIKTTCVHLIVKVLEGVRTATATYIALHIYDLHGPGPNHMLVTKLPQPTLACRKHAL